MTSSNSRFGGHTGYSNADYTRFEEMNDVEMARPSARGEELGQDYNNKQDKKTSKRDKRNNGAGAAAEEDDELEFDYKPFNWKRVFLTPKYIPWWILLLAIIAFTIWATLRHDQVVDALRPFSEKVRDLPAGWLIPIAILFIISFPPLFGHEIIAILVGVVWGLWIGFGIVAAGTFLGELGTWFAFKSLLRKRALRLERTNLNYGAMARLSRDGGFWFVLIVRFSAVPTHFSTAVFSTCDVKFWYFAVATFIALPKQLVIVYLGVLLVQQQSDGLVKDVLLGITAAITVVMAGWIYWKMRGTKKVLLEEQARRKEARESGRSSAKDSSGEEGASLSMNAESRESGGVAGESSYGSPERQYSRDTMQGESRFEPYRPPPRDKFDMATGQEPWQAQGEYDRDDRYYGHQQQEQQQTGSGRPQQGWESRRKAPERQLGNERTPTEWV